MGAEKTSAPIYIYSKPIGSTCSIVYGHYRMAGVEPDRLTALLMLSGLLSDTMLLRSPTTTPEDRIYATELSRLAEVDLQEYGTLMLSRMASLKNADPQQMVSADFKEYAENGLSAWAKSRSTRTLADIDEVEGQHPWTASTPSARSATCPGPYCWSPTSSRNTASCSARPGLRRKRNCPTNGWKTTCSTCPRYCRAKQLLPQILQILEVLRKG